MHLLKNTGEGKDYEKYAPITLTLENKSLYKS